MGSFLFSLVQDEEQHCGIRFVTQILPGWNFLIAIQLKKFEDLGEKYNMDYGSYVIENQNLPRPRPTPAHSTHPDLFQEGLSVQKNTMPRNLPNPGREDEGERTWKRSNAFFLRIPCLTGCVGWKMRFRNEHSILEGNLVKLKHDSFLILTVRAKLHNVCV